jgi:hypothetical protein
MSARATVRGCGLEQDSSFRKPRVETAALSLRCTKACQRNAAHYVSARSLRMRDQLVTALGLAAKRLRRAGSAGEQRFHLLTRGVRLHRGPGAGQT